MLLVSKRDPGEIAQTRILSSAFVDHICWARYQLIWGSVYVNFMLGSKLCSRKSTSIAVSPLSHAAWMLLVRETIDNSPFACTVEYLIFVMTIQNISDDLIAPAT